MTMIYLFLGCVLFSLSTLSVKCDDTTKLVLLQIVFRHGDRTPVTVYPNDPNKASIWDKYGGLGQLTQRGMQQHYTYGEYLRARYASFLDPIYNRNKVQVKCTDYDRTQMSAASLLASLYKPMGYQQWNANLTWQPIPIHTTDIDTIFMPNCPRYNQLQEEVTKMSEYKQASSQYEVQQPHPPNQRSDKSFFTTIK
jgi:hypothetical protein